MSMPRDSDQEARPMDLEDHERCYLLMNQEIGAQERHANETAQPWRNRGKSHVHTWTRILLILLTATESITSNFVILTCVYIMKP